MKRSAIWLGTVLIVGCGTNYYIVKDPSTGETYYATGYKTMENGAVKLTDAKTQHVVTLPTSSIREVQKDEYDAQLQAAKTAPPAPPAGATPAATPPPASK